MQLTANLRRIVGNSQPDHWAQTFVLEQDVEEQGLLVAVVSIQRQAAQKKEGEKPVAEEEGQAGAQNAATLGKQVLTVLEDSFSRDHGSPYDALKTSLTRAYAIAADTPLMYCSIVAGVLHGEALSVGVGGRGGVMIRRGSRMAMIVEGRDSRASANGAVQMVSGRPQPGDRVLFATHRFLSIVGAEVLAAAFAEKSLEGVGDAITPLLHKQDEGVGAAAIVVDIEAAAQTPEGDQESDLHAAALPRLVTKPLRTFQGQPGQRWTAVVIVGCTILVGAVGILGYTLLRPSERDQTMDGWTELIRMLEEAEQVADLNPIRSRSLLEDIATTRRSLQETEREDTAAVDQRIAALAEVLRQTYDVETPPLYFEFRLIAEGIRGDDIAADRGEVRILRRNPAGLFHLDLATKQSAVLGESIDVASPEWIVHTSSQTYVVSADGGIGRLTTDGIVLPLREEQVWGKIVDVEGYGGNIYLLDVGEGAIWKYLPVTDGLSDPRHYLRGTSLLPEGVTGMAIDGNVWVVNRRGQVNQYLNGFQQPFALTDISDPFVDVRDLYTDPEQQHLYIHDGGASRVVVVDKNGKYRAQYASPLIRDAIQVVADEASSSLYIITSGEIYRIELQ